MSDPILGWRGTGMIVPEPGRKVPAAEGKVQENRGGALLAPRRQAVLRGPE